MLNAGRLLLLLGTVVGGMAGLLVQPDHAAAQPLVCTVSNGVSSQSSPPFSPASVVANSNNLAAGTESCSVNGNNVTMNTTGDAYTSGLLTVSESVSGTVTLGSNGMGPAGNGNVVTTASGPLTVTSSGVIQGVGDLEGLNGQNINNAGLIAATTAYATNLNSTTLSLGLPPAQGNAISYNSGTLEAESGATLSISGSANGGNFNAPLLNNTGGTIQALGNGTVLLNVPTMGGLLAGAGAGSFRESTNLYSVTTSGTVTATGGAIYDSLVNNGQFTLTYGVGLASSNGSNAVAITGLGAVTLGTAAAPYALTGSNITLTLGYGETINGAGSIANTVNNGFIDANADGGTLSVGGSVTNANTQNIPSALSGVMQAEQGGNLLLNGTTVANATGLIQALDQSTVTLQASSVTGGTLSTSGSGVIALTGASLTNLTNDGHLLAGLFGGATLSGTITNSGTIELAGTNTGGFAALTINGNTTLTGGGSVTMDNQTNALPSNYIEGENNATLINDVSHTIQGAGSVYGLKLDNNGLVYANASGATLGVSATVSNNHLMYALDGGTLAFSNATVTQGTNGLIEAMQGSFITLQNSSVSGGTISSETTGSIALNGGVTLTNLTNDGTVNAASGTLSGTIVNNGQIQLGSSGNLTLSGSVDLTGTGSVTLGGGSSLLSDGNVLTIDTQQTVQGAGTVNSINEISNKGTISANASGESLSLAENVTNTGTMQATGGGTLTMACCTWNNTGGMIEALAGSKVLLEYGSISGGTLQSAGTGSVEVNGSVSLSGMTLNGSMTVDGGASVILTGTTTNNAQIMLGNGGQALYLNGTVDLAGTGSVVLSGGSIQNYGGLGTLLNDTQQTVEGWGSIYGSNIAVNNKGTINADTNGQTLALAANSVNSGTLEAGNGGTLNQYFVLNNMGGTIQALDGGTVNLNVNGYGITNYSNGTLTGGNWSALANGHGATLDLENTGTITTNDATLTLSGAGSAIEAGGASIETSLTQNGTNGTLNIENGRNYAGASGFTNNGTLQVEAASASFGGTFTNNGKIISDPASLTYDNLVVGSGGVIQAAAGDVYDIQGNFLNHSTQDTIWSTGSAILEFSGAVSHVLDLTGTNLGATAAGYNDNFAWGELEIGSGGSIMLQDGVAGPGVAFYVGLLAGADISGDGITNIAGGFDIYYDPALGGNAYLGGRDYMLEDGGMLIADPVSSVPEPTSLALLLAGLSGVAASRRRRARSAS